MKTPAKIMIVLFLATGILIAGDSANRQNDAPANAATARQAALFICPTCPRYKGETYYFWSEHSRKSFEADTEKYAKKTSSKESKTAKDPVCGMDVDIKPDTPKSEYKGKTYYFCSKFCRKNFDASPEEYVGRGMAGLNTWCAAAVMQHRSRISNPLSWPPAKTARQFE